MVEHVGNLDITNNNIVIWGCGDNAAVLLRQIPNLTNNIMYFVDTDVDKQGQLFQGKYLVNSPSILDNKKHFVIVTPAASESIIQYLDQNGFAWNRDYCLQNQYLKLLTNQYILDIYEHNSDKIIFCLQPSASHIYKPSPIEKALIVQGSIIKDQFQWLKSNPPHIENAHKDLPYYSESYIEEIFVGYNPMQINEELLLCDHNSEFVNVIGGKRYTTDQPDYYDHRIHVFGPSWTYGFGVEDKYTVPSCLQRIINDHYPNTYLVVNHGIRGLELCNYRNIIDKANIQNGDIVIVTISYSDDVLDFLSISQIPFINLCSVIQRPHDRGEIFINHGHMNYKGNIAISCKIFEMVDTYIHRQIHTKNSHGFETEISNAQPTPGLDSVPDLSRYIDFLRDNQFGSCSDSDIIGSIVMNCNPFTLGHYHLINIASQIVDYLYIFIVEEDKSVFSFSERYELVKQGIQDIENVKLFPSGKYIISNITFPEYFDKDSSREIMIDASFDLSIFGKYIAPALGINLRFIGEEPTDMVTKQYNENMKRLLPSYGIKCIEIPRAKKENTFISASVVRKKVISGELDDVKSMVPITTFEYLKENENALRKKLTEYHANNSANDFYRISKHTTQEL